MIKTAVILAAGKGVRFAPLSQFIPKELLPLGGCLMPVLGWLVREVVNAGVSEVILVSAPSKRPLERYFRFLAEEYGLKKAIVVHQEEPRGTADALLKAQEHLGQRSFLVYYCDDLWLGEPSRTQQLQEAYAEVGRPICAVVRIKDRQLLSRLGVIKIGRETRLDSPTASSARQERPGLYVIERIEEKPRRKPPSNLALVSGMILEPSIFGVVEEVIQRFSSKGEVFISNVLNHLCRTTTIYALELEGVWVDAGTSERYLSAFVQMALADPTVGEEFRAYLQKLICENPKG